MMLGRLELFTALVLFDTAFLARPRTESLGFAVFDHLLVLETARSFNLVDHDAFAAEIADLNRRLSSAEPLITPARIEKFARPAAGQAL